MVSTRGTPAPPSSSSRGKQSEQQQQSGSDELREIIQALRQEVSEIREKMDAPPPVPPPPPPPPIDPPRVEPPLREKDPRDCIKPADIPKYDGKTKEAESWMLEFTKYCCLIMITNDDHILTAFAIAMTDKAAMWWEYAEK